MASPVAKQYSAASGTLIACGRSNVAASSVTMVTEYADQRVFQRVGTSKAISVTVNFGGSPSVLQWRVVYHDSGIAATSWAVFAVNPTGTSATKSITIPQGGWYKIQVRCGTDTTKLGSTANKLGVGIIVGLIGQSNMFNRMSTSWASGRPLGNKRSVWYNNSSAFARIGNINDNAPPSTQASNSTLYNTSPGVTIQGTLNGDGWVWMANMLVAQFNVPVCLVNRAVSGTEIDNALNGWMTGQSSWNTFATAISNLGGDMELAIWHQGEADANLMSTSTMVTKLGLLHNQLKNLTGRTDNTSFKLGIVSLGVGAFGGSSEGEYGNMRAAHVQFANNTPGVFLYGVAHDSYTSEGIHIVGESYNTIDRRGMTNTLYQRYGVGTSAAGPKFSAASLSADKINVSVTHTGGTALVDGAGGSGSALTGFQIWDDGNGGASVPITATTITSSTNIQLTMGGSPAGPFRVAYAMMNNPHNASGPDANPAKNPPVLASIPCDNATYYLSTYGCPLQPFPATAVT